MHPYRNNAARMERKPGDGGAGVMGGALQHFASEALEWPLVRQFIEGYARGPLGKRALRELGPRSDGEARLALARVSEVLARRSSGGLPVGPVEDPLPYMEAGRRYGRALDGEELSGVLRFLRGARSALRYLQEHSATLTACASLAEGACDLLPLETALSEAIDERGRLQDDASQELRAARREVASLTRSIEEAVRRIAARREVKSCLAEGHAGQVHLRAGRPVLALRARSRGALPGLVHDRSQTGETIFVEPQEVVEDGNLLAVRRADQTREESRIYLELTRAILAESAAIEDVLVRVSEFELVQLASNWAASVGGVCARQPGDAGAGSGLVLRAMRHPLLVEMQAQGALDEVVPVDLRLGGDFDMLVITGPNTGGKTLALKSAGLAVLLTRLGLPLPASEGTTVPLYDGVAADIGDEQEVAQSLSTFSSHVVRIRDGLERAGPDTLVLLDELGGGTDPDEGAALGEAILETLLQRRAPTLVTTHLGKLKEFAFRHARVENASVEFDLETLAPRFRLLVGTPGESRALLVARRLGIDPAVLARAEERVERRSEEVLELLADVRRARERAEELRSEAEQRLTALERDEQAMLEVKSAIDERGRLLEAEAQRGLLERVAEARPLLARALALLPQLPRVAREELEGVLGRLGQVLTGAALGERRKAFLDGLKKGQLVYVPRFRKRLGVLRVRRDRNELTVRWGGSELTLSFDEVTEYESL